MDPIKKGALTEARGFSILADLKAKYPHFIRGVRQSPPEMDARGIDALVTVGLPEGIEKKTMTVPVEFKSSFWGVKKWRVAHSDLHKAGVLVFYLPRWKTRRQLRRLMYRGLKRVQLNSRNGTLYQSMFQRLFRGGSKNLRRIVDIIKGRRAEEKARRN